MQYRRQQMQQLQPLPLSLPPMPPLPLSALKRAGERVLLGKRTTADCFAWTTEVPRSWADDDERNIAQEAEIEGEE